MTEADRGPEQQREQVPGQEPAPIRAAGVVLWRARPGGGIEVALVHRPKYDDWSLPKGKLEPGEHVLAAAVRETAEETGCTVRLGRPLPTQRYRVAAGPKEVRYWAAEVVDGGFEPTSEVDELAWLTPQEALARLTWARDGAIVRVVAELPAPTRPLVLLRHAAAVSRSDWDGDDADRPLREKGRRQAAALPALLAAYAPLRLLSSGTARTLQTVQPFADATGLAQQVQPWLSDTVFAADPEAGLAAARALLPEEEPTVLCTHRPVLPWLVSALLDGSPVATPTETLTTAAFHVLHVAAGRVVAVEKHAPDA
jgi:phosphohistidine phosphatase SixA/predicted NUDIX family NTP pyrophosphohydrolase